MLVIGPPLIGKSSICKKLAEDLNMVYLHPSKLFEKIFEKVNKFEEELENFDDTPDVDENSPDYDPENPPPRKPKPTVDTVLTSLENVLYKDLVEGREISKENLIQLYKYIIHSDLAFSRGLIIDQNSSIGELSFAEMILDGHFGKVEIDYVVELSIPEAELLLRKSTIKLNLKTMEIISKRDIELMKKPKKPKKEKYEDDPEPEEDEIDDEEMDDAANNMDNADEDDGEEYVIPKEKDLLEITNFDKIYEEQLEYYYNIQYPKFKEYFAQLKKHYYFKLDLTGLDFDNAAELVKAKLDFIFPSRPIAQILEPSDYKDLLMANREGVVPFRRWSQWKQIDPVALKDEFVILNGSTEFPAEYCGRVFLFIDEGSRNKFIENPKKYVNKLPEVPANYRIAIVGPPKSGKNTIANALKEMFGWKKINIEDIYEEVKEYQKNMEEIEPNNVYSNKIHFSATEWKDLIAPANKKDKKPENFYSKIIFTLDHMGIKLDKKQTFEEFKEEKKYHSDKLNHLLNPPKRNQSELNEDGEIMDNVENNEDNINMNADENIIGETNLNKNPDDGEVNNNNNNNELINPDVINNVENPEETQEEEEYIDPFPPEEDYIIDDLRSDQFYYAFNEDGSYQRPSGFILLSHPTSEEEINKFNEFNIIFDKIIYLVDQSEEPLKALMTRKIPNFNNLDEEKQTTEVEKMRLEVTKVEEIITLLREKYNRNNEDHVIEVNCAENLEDIKFKLLTTLNPFYSRVDNEERIYTNGDIPEDKAPIPKGEFGIFCPVTYKDEKWLFYAQEEFELQVNQRRYRFASEKELEIFKKDPNVYLKPGLDPIPVLPPHIFITGHQGGGISYYTNLLSKEYKLRKRDLKTEFMAIWEEQSLSRKQLRINKKREELIIQKEEQEKERKETIANNPDAANDEFEEMNIEELIANDAGLDEEEETFNAVDNDKEIFKSLFYPETPSIYDSTWYDMNEKITTQLFDFVNDTRRHPNVVVIIKLTLNSIMKRHLHEEDIVDYHKTLVVISLEKKKEKIEQLKAERKEEKLNEWRENLSVRDDDVDKSGISNNVDQEDKVRVPPEFIIELTEEEINEIMEEQDPDLPELQTLVENEKEKLTKRFEDNTNFINEYEELLKNKLIPYIIVQNDINFENVTKSILYQLRPYIQNRHNLVEKQLTFYQFPEMNIRKSRDLMNSQVFKLSAYNMYSSVNPERLLPRTQYPVIYRDKIYYFNNEDERNIFAEEPLNYKTGKEFPLDVTNNLRQIIYVIGNMRSGKTTLSKIVEELGYYRLNLKRATYDLLNILEDCLLKREIVDVLTNGESIGDSLAIKILSKRLKLADLINRNIVIDGTPFTLSQVDLLDKEGVTPTYIFVSNCNETKIRQRAGLYKGFKALEPVVNERISNYRTHLKDIIKSFQNKQYDLRYLDNEKSMWYLKDRIVELLENRRKNELSFSDNYNKGKPGLLTNILPKKVLNGIVYTQDKIKLFSPVSLKIKNEFYNNKHMNNYITLYNSHFHFLRNEEEFKHFTKQPNMFDNFLETIKRDIKPPKVYRFESISELVNHDDVYEYQSCCPVTASQDKLMKEGKLIYTVLYQEKLYKFDNVEKMKKFCISPDKYANLKVNVKTTNDNEHVSQTQVNFENTVSYLETNFGSLITKGLLELSKNRIKYPYLSVKETSIKYLALYLKANNPNNNKYAKVKYAKKLDEFMKNSKLPFELLNVYENYSTEKEKPLKKELIRKQLNNLSMKYDDLMDKAKIQKNTRFEGFFKN